MVGVGRQHCLLLSGTALHAGSMTALQTFRAGSAMFAPILWRGAYLEVMICARAVRNTFGEQDLIAHQALCRPGRFQLDCAGRAALAGRARSRRDSPAQAGNMRRYIGARRGHGHAAST